MEPIAHDVRIAWRGFRRTPGFAIAVLIVLSISIGSAVAMFTTTRAVLLQQMPVLQPERLAVLTSYQIPTIEVSPPATVLRQMRHRLNSVTDIAGVGHWGTIQSPYVEGEQTRILNHSDVTANYFSVLGARAFLGRLFVDADEGFGAAPPMVLSYRAWQSTYGGDSSVIGRQLMWPYTRVVYTIVGVAPPGLDYPLGVECWTPIAADDSRQMLAVVRLKRGVSLEAAQMEYFREADRLHPMFHLKGASGKPLMDVVVGDARPALSLLSAAVALLLVIACVNIANMFLLRAGQRARELALRRVLGASHWSIVRQLLTESMMLAATGGVLGTAVAVALIRAVVWFAPQQLPRLDLLRIDVSVYVIAIGVTVLCVVAFGVTPALIAASASKEKSARASARAGTQTRVRTRLRDGLVASQVALALTLLVAAGLVSRSLMSLQNESLGYEPTHLSVASVAWDATKSGTPEKILAMGRELERRLRALPEIQSVSPILLPPFYGVSVWHGTIQGEADAPNALRSMMDVPIEIGGSGYFETMGIPLMNGRGFLDSDNSGTEPVVVVSESVAKHFWPGQAAVGRRIRSEWGLPKPEPWSTVIGVVADTRYRSLRTASPMIYHSWQQMEGWQGTFAIRSTKAAALLMPKIQTVARAVDPTLVLGELRSMDDALSAPLSTPRLLALLLSGFGAISILLAAVGLYGVLASSVREQVREIGIRSALGAAPSRIVFAVVVHAVTIAGLGAAVGLAVALGATRFIQSVLYKTSPTDVVTLLSATAALIVVAMIAAAFPAVAATRIQPMIALRAE